MTVDRDQLLQLVRGIEVPGRVLMRDSDADVLSPGRGFIGAFDYTMQLQVGCQGGCLYCYVPASARLTPTDMRRNWGFEVRVKRRAIAKFGRRLSCGALADRTIYWSGVTDPYASAPQLTRAIWQQLIAAPSSLRPRRLAIQSRFRVDRDVSLIAEYNRTTVPSDLGPPVVVSFSVGTDRNDVIRLWERATPSFEQRIRAVETLCRSGVFVVVTLSPFGPWDDLPGALRRFQSCGVRYLTVLFFKQEHCCASTPAPFLAYLRREWPDLLDVHWQADQLAEMVEVFGPGGVIQDQAGFSSLVAPHRVARDGSRLALPGKRF
jgi:DNA repair photolyase